MFFCFCGVIWCTRGFGTNHLETIHMNLTSSQLTKLGMALGICFAVYKFVPHSAAKAAALGVAGVVVGKQVPYLSDALA